MVNIYIVYTKNKNLDISSYPTLENCLLDAVKLTKHPDIDQYKYLDIVLDLIEKDFFHLVMELVGM